MSFSPPPPNNSRPNNSRPNNSPPPPDITGEARREGSIVYNLPTTSVIPNIPGSPNIPMKLTRPPKNTPTNSTQVPTTNTPKPPRTSTVIFIRHGVSCANLRKKTGYLYDFTSILDPALTVAGIMKAKNRGIFLRELLDTTYSNKETKVCASLLLRTQQTACFMLMRDDNNGGAKNGGAKKQFVGKTNPITILPYISELPNNIAGPIFGLTADNRSSGPEKQAGKLPDGITCELAKGFPMIGKDKHDETPSVEKFKEFIKTSPLFNDVNDKVILIFTHGHFIVHLAKSLGVKIAKEDRPNYATFISTYNLDKKELEGFIPHKFKDIPTNSPHYFISDKIDKKEECLWINQPEYATYSCDQTVCSRTMKQIPKLPINPNQGGKRTRNKKHRKTRNRRHRRKITRKN